jgi:hypothetical protein
VINKLIGAKSKKKVTKLEQIIGAPSAVVTGTWQTITRTLFEPGEAAAKKKDDAPNQLQYLPPNVRAIVEAIGIKISKLAFNTKFRIVYLARHDVFSGTRVAGIMGALKQFNTMDMNGFRPHKTMKTSVDYWFVETRTNSLRRRLLRAYKNRSMTGGNPITMNIEELASIWHFPVITVKAPSVKKMEAKRGEPPVSLPVGEYAMSTPVKAAAPVKPTTAPERGQAPSNLPTK